MEEYTPEFTRQQYRQYISILVLVSFPKPSAIGHNMHAWVQDPNYFQRRPRVF